MATPETRRQVLAAVAACDDKKGEDTRILELDPADSGLADFFLITSASNDRQVVAIADEIELRLKKDFGLYATSVEGRRQAEWILLDYVDLVIHVFLAEKRAFYDIERLRKSARNLSAPELEAELKAVLAQKTLAVRKNAPPAKSASAGKASAKSRVAMQERVVKRKDTTQKGSTVTAKSTKKAAKKAAAKPAKAAKAASPAAAKVAAKPVKKAATKAAKPAAAPEALGAIAPDGRVSTGGFGKSPILSPAKPGTLGAEAPVVETKPLIEQAAEPAAGALSLAASAAPKAAKKAAKKAPAKAAKKAAAKSAKKAPAKKAAKKGKK